MDRTEKYQASTSFAFRGFMGNYRSEIRTYLERSNPSFIHLCKKKKTNDNACNKYSRLRLLDGSEELGVLEIVVDDNVNLECTFDAESHQLVC